MKITKYVHSCLLIEDADYTAIIDPGIFSWDSGLFNTEILARLDDIIITHEHPDHMALPFIQALRAKFPNVEITTTPAAAAILTQQGLENVTTMSHGKVELFATAHESNAPLGETPQNTGVHLAGIVTHPGDSHHFTETKAVLALPVTGPWGSVMAAAQLALDLKPRVIVPIHDWHWNDSARQQLYERLAAFFAEHDITFVKTQDGVGFEV